MSDEKKRELLTPPEHPSGEGDAPKKRSDRPLGPRMINMTAKNKGRAFGITGAKRPPEPRPGSGSV